MYLINPLNGKHLPDKTLCLTYDDGPGEQTLAIAEYLHQENIKATFFVVGKYAIHDTDTLAALKAMGHIIGNHTYEHPDIPYYISVGGDIQNQILRTDAIVKNYTDNPVFFRAPYGKWSKEVANELNLNLLATINHVGPIHWDIDGIDCYYWQLDKSVEEATTFYLSDIRKKEKGIVVFHDDIADMDVVKWKSKTLELTKQLIPILKKEGYCFIGLDEVYKTSDVIEHGLQINLLSSKKNFVSIENSDTLFARTRQKSDASKFKIQDAGNGKITISNHSFSYLIANAKNEISFSDNPLTSESFFDFIPVADNRFMLRTFTGNFVAIDKSGRLSASAKYMRLAEIFSYKSLSFTVDKSLSFKEKIKLWKKRLAFIKSKLLSR